MPFSSFFAALSGLNANSTALSVIGNNLANLNTVGYKGSRSNFKDLFNSTLIGFSGAGTAVQLGLGVTLGGIQTLFNQGSIQTTGVGTDVAIQGNGFFVLGLSGSQAGSFAYSRAGNFSINPQGYLVNQQGLLVQGYPAALSGSAVAPSGPLAPIRIPYGVTSPPRATTQVQLTSNLDASVATGTKITTPVTIYDTLGQAHTATYTFTKVSLSGSPPSFSFDVTMDGGDISGGTVGQPYSLLRGAPAAAPPGTLTFDGSGRLTGITGVPTVSPTNLDIRFPPAGVTFSNGSQVAANGITWNIMRTQGTTLADSSFYLSAFASPSSHSASQNGLASGTLSNISISPTGVVQGVYSNGQITPIAQLALANFSNPEGLIKAGDNLYLSSGIGSGEPNVGVPLTSGRGTLVGSALEMSTVDIAQEFTQLIIAQRGYQANSRVITTSDEIFQESINLKRP